MEYTPSYIELHKKGLLTEKIQLFKEKYKKCAICPQKCLVNRFNTDQGFCQTGYLPMISSASSHFGEEKPLVGTGGSGTIFFTGCNMKCVFCQNHDISQLMYGSEMPTEELADLMIYLQEQGSLNINFVSPTHMILQILEALKLAIEKGLHLPLVYNSGGYDDVETLQLIEGVFDIYMPDIKFASNETAWQLCKAKDYVTISKKALKEMHHQVGDLVINNQGIAKKGLMVRHLIIPGHLEDSEQIIDFIASLSKNTYFNLMNQYCPQYQAFKNEMINRTITQGEYRRVKEYAANKGLTRLNI